MRPIRRTLRCAAVIATVIPFALGVARVAAAAPAWANHAGNAQHTGRAAFPAQPLQQIYWQMPIDLKIAGFPIHYGSSLVTERNTVVVPVKVGLLDSFRVEAHMGSDGTLLWQYQPDYRLPPYGSNWIPSYGPALTPSGRLYLPAAGGTLLYTDTVDSPGTPTFTRVAFYGIANYNANPSGFDSNVRISTPLTSDSQGNVYFGFYATGANPLGLTSGIARMGADGSGTSVLASVATIDSAQLVAFNAAPVLSNDEHKVYAVLKYATNARGINLVSLDATTLAPIDRVRPRDPFTNLFAIESNSGSSTPMVAPDDRVYLGVLGNGSNGSRGWCLQFNPNLTSSGPPGGFGWDNTPSVVPTSMVPSYAGTAPYLLMTKYNNYAGNAGGDGVNKIAILDPNDSQIDAPPHTGATIMKEVLTIAGVTPDSGAGPSYPNAVREWCINTAAVDPVTGAVIANSEDGKLYRWDLATNTLSEVVKLTDGVGEAYTPTLVARDGKSYAVNDAILFAVGASPAAVGDTPLSPGRLALAGGRPSPFRESVVLRFSLPHADHARLDVFDVTGRRLARLVDAPLTAGEHSVRWDGRDAAGQPAGAGVYYARLTTDTESVARILVRVR